MSLCAVIFACRYKLCFLILCSGMSLCAVNLACHCKLCFLVLCSGMSLCCDSCLSL